MLLNVSNYKGICWFGYESIDSEFALSVDVKQKLIG